MSRLPSGYTQLEYIQSSGAQYINTGFKPNQSSRVCVDVTATLGANAFWLFGARTTNLSKTYCLLNFQSIWRSDYNASTDEQSTVNPSGRFAADKNKNVTYFNGTIGVTAAQGTFQCEYPLALFACNTAGSIAGYGSFLLHSCQIYDNGTLVRSFIPCKAPSGAVGLYDTVGAAFYGNAGAGAFTAGPEIIPDPPAAPADLQTALAIALRWTAVDGADQYNVYRDGTKIGSTTAAQYIDLTAEENQTYTYSVKAENSGGESAAASLTVYTKSGYFQYKPVIESANFP